MADDGAGWDMSVWKNNGMEPVLAPDLHQTDDDRPELSRVLESLGAVIQATKLDKGWTVTTPEKWEDENQVPADLALLHSEVSEALEAFRKDDRAGFAEELADVMIRVVGLAHGLRIDLGSFVVEKVKENRKRPRKHGGKRI